MAYFEVLNIVLIAIFFKKLPEYQKGLTAWEVVRAKLLVLAYTALQTLMNLYVMLIYDTSHIILMNLIFLVLFWNFFPKRTKTAEEEKR